MRPKDLFFITDQAEVAVKPGMRKRFLRMNPLKASILKWKFMVQNCGKRKPRYLFGMYYAILRDGGRFTCGLCMAYTCLPVTYTEKKRCPVFRKTGQYGCGNTPYHKYRMAETTGKALLAAKEELKFLRSFLPRKKKAKKS